MTSWQQFRVVQRQRLIDERLAFSDGLRPLHQQALLKQLQALLDDLPTGIIGFYWPVRGEIDCRDFVCNLIKQGWQAALPKIIDRQGPLQFRQWGPESIMEAEVWQISVPQNTEIVQPDVILVPLVGFDQQMHRLGNGGGFYDRTLASHSRPIAIGIGFEWMLLESIQPQEHDIPMDWIVTEAMIRPQQNGNRD